MNLYVTLALAALPLLGACADEGDLLPAPRADAQARPAAIRTAQPVADPEWVSAMSAAKVSGSLYRIGSFFPHTPAAAAVVLP